MKFKLGCMSCYCATGTGYFQKIVNTNVRGGKLIAGIVTVKRCLQWCQDHDACVAVDFNRRWLGCYWHRTDNFWRHRENSKVDHYVRHETWTTSTTDTTQVMIEPTTGIFYTRCNNLRFKSIMLPSTDE